MEPTIRDQSVAAAADTRTPDQKTLDMAIARAGRYGAENKRTQRLIDDLTKKRSSIN